MAGGKTAAKRSKQKDLSQEQKSVQAWVAEGLQLSDTSALAKHVAEKCHDSCSCQQLLGGLYLLLKGWAKGAADVQQLLQQLAARVDKELTAPAEGQKPSLIAC